MRLSAFVLGATLAALAGGTAARADDKADARTCRDPRAAPQALIDACARLVASPQSSEATRVNAHMNQGVGHYRLQQYEKAIAAYDQAIARKSAEPRAFLNRGLAYFALGKFDRAVEDYSAAIALNPKYATAYAARAESNERLKRTDDAIRDYKAALEHDPGLARARSALERLGVKP